MRYAFARKLHTPTRGVGGYEDDIAAKQAEIDAANAASAESSITVHEVDRTRVNLGLAMTMVGTVALAAGVLYSMPLAIGGGLLAVSGPFIALSGLGDSFALSTIETEGGGV
jgi:hypothetical protein